MDVLPQLSSHLGYFFTFSALVTIKRLSWGPVNWGPLAVVEALGCSLVSLVVNPALTSVLNRIMERIIETIRHYL